MHRAFLTAQLGGKVFGNERDLLVGSDLGTKIRKEFLQTSRMEMCECDAVHTCAVAGGFVLAMMQGRRRRRRRRGLVQIRGKRGGMEGGKGSG
jgi:hypothetical protein